MPLDSSTRNPVRFGVFSLDLASGELRKRGVKVRLQEQPFQILSALLEEPGRVVTREEIRDRLWPDGVFVGYEQGIATAVNKLREALGDSASNPRFVETLPRRGYRFIAAVEGGRKPEAAAEAAPDEAAPAYLSSFVGREEELEQAGRLLAASRLLTLTGPGGSGKTRLALELADKASGAFPDGVCFVALASTSSPDLVAPQVARALRLAEGSTEDAEDAVCAELAGRQMLLVLDNFEQVLEAAGFLRRLLAGCSGVRALVTSRAALRIDGEQEFPVPPLGLPSVKDARRPETAAAAPAVRLFLERARAVDPGFALTDENVGCVSSLCRRLDGLPLAIELAAARTRLFSPRDLMERLGSRLDLLKGRGDAPERHRTLRQAIAWSYDLLEPAAQQVFRRLAVFDGGLSLDEAESLCGDGDECAAAAFDALEALAEHHLIRREGRRFTMLDSIRAFGVEKLREQGEEPEARRLHAERFLDLAREAEPHLTGPDQARWLDRLDAEQENFRAALIWAGRRGESALGLRLGAALWRYWISRGRLYEGLPLLEGLLAAGGSDDDPAARLDALHGVGTLAHYQGQVALARRALGECVERTRDGADPGRQARALAGLAWVHCATSELDACERLSQEALAIHESLGDARGAALALNNLGWAAMYRGRSARSREFHERSLELRRRIGDRRGVGFALINASYAERLAGRLDRCADLLDEACETLRPIGDPVLNGWRMLNDALLAHLQGRDEAAAGILLRALDRWSRGAHRSLLAWTQTVLGALLLDWGEPERGCALLAEGEACWRSIECPWGVARAQYERGRWMVGRGDGAAGLLHGSLRTRRRIGDELGVAECLEAIARLTAGRRPPELSVALLGAADKLRERIEAPLPERGRALVQACAETLRLRLGEPAFAAALASPDAEPERAVSTALEWTAATRLER